MLDNTSHDGVRPKLVTLLAIGILVPLSILKVSGMLWMGKADATASSAKVPPPLDINERSKIGMFLLSPAYYMAHQEEMETSPVKMSEAQREYLLRFLDKGVAPLVRSAWPISRRRLEAAKFADSIIMGTSDGMPKPFDFDKELDFLDSMIREKVVRDELTRSDVFRLNKALQALRDLLSSNRDGTAPAPSDVLQEGYVWLRAALPEKEKGPEEFKVVSLSREFVDKQNAQASLSQDLLVELSRPQAEDAGKADQAKPLVTRKAEPPKVPRPISEESQKATQSGPNKFDSDIRRKAGSHSPLRPSSSGSQTAPSNDSQPTSNRETKVAFARGSRWSGHCTEGPAVGELELRVEDAEPGRFAGTLRVVSVRIGSKRVPGGSRRCRIDGDIQGVTDRVKIDTCGSG